MEDIKKGFGQLPKMQSIFRDRVNLVRIPDALTAREDELSQQAADYIYELEEFIVTVAKERFGA